MPAVRTCPDVSANVIIEPKLLGIKWDGWGTSLGWWANWAGGLPKDTRDRFSDLLFDRNRGLGLNIVRYNIGGGGYAPKARKVTGSAKYRRTPGFKWTRNSPYNWSSDADQRTILLAAKRRGANVFEAYSNSPPAWMTMSGDFSGSPVGFRDNLHPRNYGAFADYLTDVVSYYRRRWGVTFQTLEPFNEAYEGNWRSGNVQEGCNFNGTSINNFIKVLATKIKARRLPTKISAADSLAKNTAKIVNRFLDSRSRSLVSQYNVHTYEQRNIITNYDRQVRYRTVLAAIVAREKKKLWVSEWGPFNMRGSEMDIALGLARFVMLDINTLRASGWIYWQAIEEFAAQPYWGLIFSTHTSRKPFNYRIRPQYYVLMQFTKWIRPGDFPLKLHSSCKYGMLVSYSALHKRLIIVVANYLYTSQLFVVNIRFRSMPGRNTEYTMFRTSLRERCQQIETRMVNIPGRFRIYMPARSVTTYVFDNVRWG